VIALEWIRFGIAAALLLGGMVFLFAALVGIFRFKTPLARIHVAAKCDTFGLLLMLSSLMVMYGWSYVSLKLLLVVVFYWMSVPVASHLIGYLELMTNPKVKEECKVINNVDN